MSRPKERAPARRLESERIAQELQLLPRQSTRELSDRWKLLMGTPPPTKLSRDLLMRAIAEKLQEAAFGGLPLAAMRRLAALSRSAEKDTGSAAVSPMLRLKPGSTLVRAWRGKTHAVLVLETDFEYQGRRYTSLTQIAHEITGAHWSGPRFFGLVASRQTTTGSKVSDGSP